MSTNPSNHIYEIILNSAPEDVWKALTDGEMTQKYFFASRVESAWTVDSVYNYYDPQGGVTSDGKILEIKPQSHLKMTWRPTFIPDTGSELSTLTWDLQPLDSLTLLRLTHSDIDDATFEAAQMGVGWVFVLSSIKTLLETGNTLPTPDALAG